MGVYILFFLIVLFNLSTFGNTQEQFIVFPETGSRRMTPIRYEQYFMDDQPTPVRPLPLLFPSEPQFNTVARRPVSQRQPTYHTLQQPKQAFSSLISNPEDSPVTVEDLSQAVREWIEPNEQDSIPSGRSNEEYPSEYSQQNFHSPSIPHLGLDAPPVRRTPPKLSLLKPDLTGLAKPATSKLAGKVSGLLGLLPLLMGSSPGGLQLKGLADIVVNGIVKPLFTAKGGLKTIIGKLSVPVISLLLINLEVLVVIWWLWEDCPVTPIETPHPPHPPYSELKPEVPYN